MEELLNLPPVASAHGSEIDHSIVTIHWLMLALFIGWGAFYVMTLIRFRQSKNPKANYAGAKSKIAIYLAAVVAVFELTMLYTVDAPLWAERVARIPDEKDALVVRVVAEQFAWNIHYAGRDNKFGKASISLIDADNPLGLDRSDPDAKDDIVTVNQLNLPVNKPVIIRLTSKDVIHSFNLPLFRIKQDAIPGLTIPVWFVPTKTTDQVREEWRRPFSPTDAMAKARRASLPAVTVYRVSKGSSDPDAMLMNDVLDKDGAPLLSKGERLTEDNVGRLADAGIAEVAVRTAAGMDKLVLMEEQKDTAGNVIVARNESLTEDAVSKLVGAGLKDIAVRPASVVDPYVVMEPYSDKTGAPIAAKGDPLSEEIIAKLADAGITTMVIAPATPTEIACAQLCGLGHYRMRGYLTVQTPEAFQQWFDEQEAALVPPPADSTAAQGTH